MSLTCVLALLALAAAPDGVRAQAKGPTFDCAKAQGEVEQLICKDEGLAALDRKLDEVYKAALAKARDDVPQLLRTEQRGWVSGRNECWKAKDADNAVYLTASWTATSVRECVEARYRIRTAELQALYQLVRRRARCSSPARTTRPTRWWPRSSRPTPRRRASNAATGR